MLRSYSCVNSFNFILRFTHKETCGEKDCQAQNIWQRTHSAPYFHLDEMRGDVFCYSKAFFILLHYNHHALANLACSGDRAENEEMLRDS